MNGKSGSCIQDHNQLAASGSPFLPFLSPHFPTKGRGSVARQADFTAYLAKPFSEDELLACIRSILERHKMGGDGS